MTGQALPLSELFSFSQGEMLAFKRAGWLPSIAKFIAEVLDPRPRYSGGRRLMRNCSTGTVFWGTDPPTDFETLVATLAGIFNTWGPGGSRDRIEAIVTARRPWIHVLEHHIEADFAAFPWLSDRLESCED